jgi:hypothetical protein
MTTDLSDKAKEPTDLSDKAKENLRRNEELRKKEGKFVKFQDGKEGVYKFNPEDVEGTYRQFDGESKKKLRFQYIVTDEEGNKKTLELCSKWSKQIDELLEHGENLIAIRREGTGKWDTKFHIRSAK